MGNQLLLQTSCFQLPAPELPPTWQATLAQPIMLQPGTPGQRLVCCQARLRPSQSVFTHPMAGKLAAADRCSANMYWISAAAP